MLTIRITESICQRQVERLFEALFSLVDSLLHTGDAAALDRLVYLLEKGSAFNFDLVPTGRAGEQRILLKPSKDFT